MAPDHALTDRERARAFWLRQLVLTGVALLVGGGAVLLLLASLRPNITSPWPVVVAGLALAATLIAVLHHAAHVAAFTFRRELED